MANFVSSNLVAAQTKFKEKFASPEVRRKQNPAFALALKNMTAVFPDYMALRTREDRAVNAYLFKRIAPGTGTARAARPTGSRGDSVQQGLTWQTVVEPFAISMKQADNNVYAYQDMLMNHISQAIKNIHSRIGTILLNFLFTNRNQVQTIPYTGAAVSGVTPNAGNFSYEVAGADSTYFFQKMANVMRQLNYTDTLDVIADPISFVAAQKLRAQGTQNATNLAFQFDGINELIFTNEVIDTNYTNGTCLTMPEGTFALMPWIPKQNREGRGDFESYTGGYSTLEDPTGLMVMTLNDSGVAVPTPLRYAIYGYTQASDEQANNGQTQDQLTIFEISLDFAPTLAPLTTANESVVNEFAQLNP